MPDEHPPAIGPRFVVEPSSTLAGRWQVRDTKTGQVARTRHGALATEGNLAVYADRGKADDFARRANDEKLSAARARRAAAREAERLEREEAKGAARRKAG